MNLFSNITGIIIIIIICLCSPGLHMNVYPSDWHKLNLFAPEIGPKTSPTENWATTAIIHLLPKHYWETFFKFFALVVLLLLILDLISKTEPSYFLFGSWNHSDHWSSRIGALIFFKTNGPKQMILRFLISDTIIIPCFFPFV